MTRKGVNGVTVMVKAYYWPHLKEYLTELSHFVGLFMVGFPLLARLC